MDVTREKMSAMRGLCIDFVAASSSPRVLANMHHLPFWYSTWFFDWSVYLETFRIPQCVHEVV